MTASEPLATIEPMRVADVATIAAIEHRVFTSPWSAHAFLFDLTRRRNTHYLVARYQPWYSAPKGRSALDNSIMGYAGAWFVVDEAHVATLAVRPEWRGRGIGEWLFLSLLRWAVAQGARFATLEVRVSNVIAQGLYAKYELERVGRRRRYYSDNREDALLMTNDHLWSPRFLSLLDDRERALRDHLPEALTPPPELQPLSAMTINA